MKKLKRILPMILMMISILVIPVNAYATERDFGNYAGAEDFSYDSSWQVEQNSTAPQYTASGNDSSSEVSEKFLTYEWTLTRTTGVKTKTSAGVTTQTCPHCGAQVNINQTAECPYCGSIMTTDTFDWAIDNITALTQKTK